MAKYTRAKIFQFIDNTNPELGVVAVLTDEPIRCDYWTEPDPETGDPVQHEVCPDMYEYTERMGTEYAVAAYANPNQTMLYFQMSEAMATKWVGLTAQEKLNVKNKAWTNYSIKWMYNPNALPEAPTE
jgi:hypothetical protein